MAPTVIVEQNLQFILAVEDNEGGRGSDTSIVTVMPLPPPVAVAPEIQPGGGDLVGPVECHYQQRHTRRHDILHAGWVHTNLGIHSSTLDPFMLTSDAAIKAFAVADGFQDSGVTTALFNLEPEVPLLKAEYSRVSGRRYGVGRFRIV